MIHIVWEGIEVTHELNTPHPKTTWEMRENEAEESTSCSDRIMVRSQPPAESDQAMADFSFQDSTVPSGRFSVSWTHSGTLLKRVKMLGDGEMDVSDKK